MTLVIIKALDTEAGNPIRYPYTHEIRRLIAILTDLFNLNARSMLFNERIIIPICRPEIARIWATPNFLIFESISSSI